MLSIFFLKYKIAVLLAWQNLIGHRVQPDQTPPQRKSKRLFNSVGKLQIMKKVLSLIISNSPSLIISYLQPNNSVIGFSVSLFNFCLFSVRSYFCVSFLNWFSSLIYFLPYLVWLVSWKEKENQGKLLYFCFLF